MTQTFKMDNTEEANPLIRADWLDKAVGLLALAKQHNIILSVNGDKLRMSRAHSVDPLVIEILARNKADIIEVMGMPDAIKRWLSNHQEQLANRYDALTDGMDRWDWVEQIYHDLFPVDRECVCSRGHCIDSAIITCNACAKKNQTKKGV